MLTTRYVVLDEYSFVEYEEDGTTAIFESKEDAEKVRDFLHEEYKEVKSVTRTMGTNLQVIPFVTKD